MQFQPARVPQRLRLWSLSEHVLVEVGPLGDHLVAFTQWGEIRIDDASPEVRESLRRMSLGPVSLENLPIPREDARQRLEKVLERLGNCVVQSLGLDDEAGPLLSVAPVSRRASLCSPPQVDVRQPIRLSRFVVMRTGDGELLLESPLAQHRVVLHRPMAGCVIGSLGRTTTVTDLAAVMKIAVPVLADIIAYLIASGMVLTAEHHAPDEAPGEAPDETSGGPVRFAEDGDPKLIPWSHHDLLFHTRSRMGRHNGHTGAVFPYVDRLPAAPVVKPPPVGTRFPLHRPEVADLVAGDPPLTEVIESRGDHRKYSAGALNAEQVGELLFRVARIRWIKLTSSAVGDGYVVSDRPYPSTSDLYELELYLSLDRCAGLPRGSYHYDPSGHALTLVNDSESRLTELMDNAKVAAGSTQRPPVLITLTTRIARLSWMYSGIAYSTTLKHVGALQQTLELAATAMGLASCALAMNDGGATDDALRLEWPTEVSVGEFIIGVRP